MELPTPVGGTHHPPCGEAPSSGPRNGDGPVEGVDIGVDCGDSELFDA
jgi:hypothetical protein